MPAYADAILLKIKNRKLFAILAPVIAGILLGGHIVVKPILKSMDYAKTEKASYAEKETVYKNIMEWDKKMAPFRAEEGKVVDKTALIEQLNSLAGKSGLTILSITPDEKKLDITNIESMLIRIDAEGNYHQLAEFISQTESMKTHIRVTSLEINRETISDQVPSGMVTATKSKDYKMSLSLTVYFGAKD